MTDTADTDFIAKQRTFAAIRRLNDYLNSKFKPLSRRGFLVGTTNLFSNFGPFGPLSTTPKVVSSEAYGYSAVSFG